MVKRTIIGRSGEEILVDYIKQVDRKATAANTRPMGMKVLGFDEDIQWETPGGTTTSVRNIDEELSAAQGRIDDAAAALIESQARLDEAEQLAAETQTKLDNIEGVELPAVRAELEAAAQQAAQDLAVLDGKLVTAQAELDAAEANLVQLETDLGVESAARDQLAQDMQQTFSDLDDRLAVFADDEAMLSIRNALDAAKDAADAAQGTANAAVTAANAANQAALQAAGIADAKGRVIFSETAPTGDDRNPSNLWIQPSTEKTHIWDGDSWEEITSDLLDQAAQNAIDAKNAASQAQQTADTAIANAAAAQAAAEAAQQTADKATTDARDAWNEAVAAQAAADAAFDSAINHILNPSFERDGIGATASAISGNITDERARSGNRSFVSSGGGGWVVGDSIPVAEGQIWRLSMWYFLEDDSISGSGGLRLQRSLDGGATWPVQEAPNVDWQGGSGAWKQQVLEYQVGAGVTHIRPRLAFSYPGPSRIWVDDLSLVDATELIHLEAAADNAQRRAEEAIAEASEAKGLAQDAVREVGDTVRNTVIEYAVGSSETVAPTSGWSTSTPTRTPGSFVWMRTIVTYADGDTSTTSPALLTGNAGAKGDKGDRGADGIPGNDGIGLTGTALAYALSTSGTTAPTSGWVATPPTPIKGRYLWTRTIWTYSDASTETGYSVAYLATDGAKGNDGIAGKDGVGIASTSVTYAASSSGTVAPTSGWTAQPPAAAAGQFVWTKTVWTYTDNTSETGYSVGKIGNTGAPGAKGDKGDPGADGVPGKDGLGLKSTALAYALSTSGTTAPTTGWTSTVPSPIKGRYLWTRTVWTYTDNTSETGYSVAYLATDGAKGNDGIAGKDGVGVTATTITYAVSSSGTTAPTSGWVATPPAASAGQYVWTKTVWTYSDSTTETGYSVGKIGNTGATGSQGIQGPKGADGSSLYTWIKYADTPTSGMSDLPTGKKYMGIAYNKASATESSTYSDYEWSLIEGPQGNQGIQGPKGSDGQTTYTWIKYGTSSAGAGMSDSPTGKTYIGIAYNKTTATESTVASDYTWALIQGPKGDTGSAGATGPKGDTGSTGAQGVSVSSVSPFFRTVSRSSGAPAQPSGMTPSGWATTEPAWSPDTKLYRAERIVYSNGTVSWTPPTLVAAYEGIVQVQTSVNGKNSITRSTADASGSGVVAGDAWYKVDSSGDTMAMWIWSGSAWVASKVRNEMIDTLDVNKLKVHGTATMDSAVIDKLWVDGINARSLVAARVAVGPSNIYRDPNLSLISGFAPSYYNSDGGKTGGGSILIPASTAQTGAYDTFYSAALWRGIGRTQVKAGTRYKIGAWVRASAAHTGSGVVLYGRAWGVRNSIDSADSVWGPGVVASSLGTPLVANTWTWIEGEWTAPEGTLELQLGCYVQAGVEIAVRFSDISVVPLVGAVMIENGAVNADKITASEEMGAKLGRFINIETSQLKATTSVATPSAVIDKLWTDGLSAKAITTSNLRVTSPNVYRDPGLTEGAWWSSNTHHTYDATGGYYGDGAVIVASGTGQKGGYDFLSDTADRRTAVTPNTEYVLGAWVRTSANHSTTNGIAMFLRWYSAVNTNTILSISTVLTSAETIKSGTWTWVQGVVKSPDTAIRASLGLYVNASFTGSVRFSTPILRRAVTGTEIADGTINTVNLNVTGEMAAEIVGAMSVNTKKLVVTEEAVLQHATLIGDTVVDNINVQGKLIGTNGVFTGTVDFANINVTGGVLADKLKGNTLLGATVSTSLNGSAPEVRLGQVSNKPVIMLDDGQTAVPATITSGIGDPYRGTGGFPGEVTISAGGPTGGSYSQVSISDGRVDVSAFRPTDGAQSSMYLRPAEAKIVTYNDSTGLNGGTLEIRPDRFNLWLSGASGQARIEMGERALDNTSAGLSISSNGSIRLKRTVGAYRGLSIDDRGIFVEGGLIADGTRTTGNLRAEANLQAVGAATTSAAANVYMSDPGHGTYTEAGRLYRSTSSRRYKKNIVNWSPSAESVLALQPRQWQHGDPNSPIDERWHVGFVAEEVHDLGLKGLVRYEVLEGDYVPDGLNYERFSAAQQVVLQKHEAEINELRERIALLESQIGNQ